jgi:TolA-binding protein
LAAYEKFKLLEDSPKSILAAEANYYKAYQFFLKGEYEKSNEVIANISNKYGNSGIWSAKSILLMAKNFIELDDSFQSSYILENLIENFKEFPNIKSIAEDLLIEVNRKISEKNSSFEIKKNINE